MTRATIDFGIDLGTTNSAIAVLQGKDIHVFKNNQSEEYTPSAVWIDKSGQLFVGRTAKDRSDSDSGNAFVEFKLQMGKPRDYRFARSGRVMKPEELSTEVLKALKASVMQRTQEDVRAAVITVPAAFETDQCNATRKAAEMAGFIDSPLLQEPIAAALAYGFQSKSDKVFWLVYDLGGGTFDAAVMSVRDGEIKVVNHGGDNHLGGKLIDWSIVEELFIPALTRQYKLTDFRRGNPRWVAAIAKLKGAAEQAKIGLSDNQSMEIDIDYLGVDEQNQAMSFEYKLQRNDVERLAEPFILRSINICKKVLAEKRLVTGNIEKILLVGGPTLMPFLRERLADKKEGLGIELEFSIDPLTVVARGAAIFAGTQRLTQEKRVQQQGVYTISFPDWTFQGNDSETVVGGGISTSGGEQSFQNYTIEFINAGIRPPWRSGQMKVGDGGKFMTSLWVKQGEANNYTVELRDPTGRLLPSVTDPSKLTYTVGMVINNIPLTHSIGVALANNEVEWFLEKGRDLPARGRKNLRTAFEVRQGQDGDVIRILVIEGGNSRADRNRTIGKLEVNAQQVRRNLPVGTEVQITIEIDASRQLRAKAYVPQLDEEYEAKFHLGGQDVALNPVRLREELEEEKKRLAQLREAGESVAVPVLEQVDQERMVHDVEVALNAAQGDQEAVDEGDKRLLDLKIALDQAEQALEWPRLVANAENLISSAREVINGQGSFEDRRNFERVEAEVRAAMQTHDVDVLAQRLEALRGLVVRLLDQKGILPIILFEQLCGMVAEMRNPMQAQQLIAEGLQVVQMQNIERLRIVNQQLSALLPTPPPPPDISTINR